jgi:(E)-4-hydroxy-3-methylbut-2-enyl-diphosphate synthase
LSRFTVHRSRTYHGLRFTIHGIYMRQTRQVRVKDVLIGGGAPVAVQSMTKTDTADVEGTVRQIEEMMRAGCEVVRVAVPNAEAAVAL